MEQQKLFFRTRKKSETSNIPFASRPRVGRVCLFPSRLAAFTLTEMILVVSIILLLGVAIFRSLSTGIKIWEHSQSFILEEDIALFLDRIGRDVQNTFRYSLMTFTGKEDWLAFPTLVRTRIDNKISPQLEYTEQMGMMRYAFDPMQSAILRQQANYSQALEGTFGPGQVIVKHVSSLKFTYLIKEGKNIKSKPDCAEGIPVAIKIDVDFIESSGHNRHISKLINIPISNQHEENDDDEG